MANFIAEALSNTIGAVVAPIANVFTRKIERKIAKDQITGQVSLAKLDNQAAVNIGIKDWESISKTLEGESWKDEAATYTFLAIIWCLLGGAIAAALGYPAGIAVMDGVAVGIAEVNALDGLVGDLLRVVVYAAVSIKAVKSFT